MGADPLKGFTMSGLGAMAQSMGSSLAPATATQSGLGKWFAAASAIQAISQVGQGFAQQGAASDEAALLQRQSDIALDEARVAAEARARDVRAFAGEQASQYLGSGVTLEGSPALILAETRRLGQQEVDALKRRGESQAGLLRTQAARTKAAGRQALLGAFTGAALGGLQNYIQSKSTFSPLATNQTSQPIGSASPLNPTFNINPGISF